MSGPFPMSGAGVFYQGGGRRVVPSIEVIDHVVAEDDDS